MSERSYKTRSEASASSRSSGVRQKASLAKLRLSQAQRANQMELQNMERQKKLEMELEKQKMELEKQKMELEKERAKDEAEKKMRAIADEVEQLELEARLIEEEENGEILQNSVRDAHETPPLGTLINSGVERAPEIGADKAHEKPTPNEENRTARWVHDQTRQTVRTGEPTHSHGTWIDAVEDRNQATSGTAMGNGTGAFSCPLPRLTLEKFDGDPLHWPRWIALFKALVHDRRELSDAERLTHLQTSLTGAARHAVEGLLCDGSLYGEALRELQCQFGSQTTVVQASLRSVLQLPAVRNNDIPALTELSRTLHSTVSVLGSMHYDADLAATTNVTAIVAKLPMSLAWKWGEHIQTLQPREPTMTDLDAWLRGQVTAARVVVGRPAVQTEGGREPSRRNCGHKSARGDRPAGVSATAATLPPDELETERCGYCGGNHNIGECDELAQFPVNERAVAMMKRARCFRCLQSGHRARDCNSPQKCAVSGCGSSRHHRLLHAMTEQGGKKTTAREENLIGVASVGRKDRILLQIVPIYVHGPRGTRLVNALLDLGSQISNHRRYGVATRSGRTCPVASTQHHRRKSVQTIAPSGPRDPVAVIE